MCFLEKLKKPYFVVAPMVGNSEEAWRILARRYGASICYTEMVNCDVFLRQNADPENNAWYTTSLEDRPLVIQICGNSSEIMLKAALKMQGRCDAIDVNLGCPQKVAKKGFYGAYLQDDWKRIESIVSTLSSNLEVPVFCKIRIFESIERSIEYAKMIERAGCSLLAVHGRTREQRGINMGLASWEHIREIKKCLKIPVLANGNMMYYEDIEMCLKYTECDGVMIGEPQLYNPFIFIGENKTSLEAIGEYLSICMERPGCAEFGNMRSHVFKLLYAYFETYPEEKIVLGMCKTINQIHEFYLGLLQKKNEALYFSDMYKLRPRSLPSIVENKHTQDDNKTHLEQHPTSQFR